MDIIFLHILCDQTSGDVKSYMNMIKENPYKNNTIPTIV